MKVFVTDGNNRAALAITRSLGREGHEVLVGAERIPCLSSVSRYCKKSVIYPNPLVAFDQFLQCIQNIIRVEKPDLVLPVSDVTTIGLAEFKNILEPYSRIPFPDYEILDRVSNKQAVLEIAKELGISVPITIDLKSPGDLAQTDISASGIDYPVVIKPFRSRIRVQNTGMWQSAAVSYAKNEQELRYIIEEKGRPEYPLLLQERVNGPGIGLFLCMQNGAAVAAFSHRRLREKPPSGGVSVLRESIPMNMSLKEQAERLLRALQWEGVAMIEFKQDVQSGQYKLMEINGRFWGSLQLAIDAGVNFPVILVRAAAGEKLSPIGDYRIGVKSRWLWGDVDALLSRLFKTDSALNLPPGHPGRLKSLLEFFKLRQANTRFEVLDWNDIRPWLYESRRWFSKGK